MLTSPQQTEIDSSHLRDSPSEQTEPGREISTLTYLGVALLSLMSKAGSGLLELDTSITATYFSLRWGMVIIAVAFPILLWLGGSWFRELSLWPPLDSMSAYYDSGMRDWFVGFLFAVAVCLYLYKGLSEKENYLLNSAGIFSVGIAVNPFSWHPAGWPAKLTPHGICAGLFFLMIVLDCWLCSGDSFALGLLPASEEELYAKKYRAIGIALIVVPLLAFLINTHVLGEPFSSSVFWIEATAIWVFAFYWHTKSGELERALAEAKKQRTNTKTMSAGQ